MTERSSELFRLLLLSAGRTPRQQPWFPGASGQGWRAWPSGSIPWRRVVGVRPRGWDRRKSWWWIRAAGQSPCGGPRWSQAASLDTHTSKIGGQLLPGGHGGKQDEALHSASWSRPLREAPEGTLPRPHLLTRHGGACHWAPKFSRSERSHWNPIFRSVLGGGEPRRQGHGVPRGKASPVHPPGQVILLCSFKGSADRLEFIWQRSPQSSHPQQTFATTSLPRGVSRAWRPLGPTQPAARLGSPGRLCGSLSDLPRAVLAWSVGTLRQLALLQPSPPRVPHTFTHQDPRGSDSYP